MIDPTRMNPTSLAQRASLRPSRAYAATLLLLVGCSRGGQGVDGESGFIGSNRGNTSKHDAGENTEQTSDAGTNPGGDSGTLASDSDSGQGSASSGSDASPSSVDNVTPTDKVDLLFVIDNSGAMGDKQRIFADAVPVLVSRLVNPVCVGAEGTLPAPAASDDACPEGYAREFAPIKDLHVGVITSSLGDFGDQRQSCTPHDDIERYSDTNDAAHLLGRLPRGAAAIAASADVAQDEDGNSLGFLAWGTASEAAAFSDSARSLVASAGEFGCGNESTLEAWYRFLVDKYPYQSLVRKPCSPGGGDDQCVGPAEDDNGFVIQDEALLAERARFLRPDSVVAIVMLTDENDCSFKASGQSWRLTEVVNSVGDQTFQPRSTSICETNPDDPCCASCGQTSPTSGCALDPACYPEGDTSDPNRYLTYTADDAGVSDDSPSLRCFKQKQRFGIDYLYPVERYINGLTQKYICPSRSDASATTDCSELNPLFDDLTTSEASEKKPARSGSRIFLTGIVGVPWQDLAVDPSAPTLKYRKAVDNNNPTAGIEWSWLLGDDPLASVPVPADPFLHEQVEPRAAGAQNPALPSVKITHDGESNVINGHEWNVTRKNDLQYACTFALPEPRDCNNLPENEGKDVYTDHWTSCTCETAQGMGHGTFEEKNPLCQPTTGGNYGPTQYSAHAYPGTRHLQVLYGVGERAIVASICPKTLQGDTTKADFGYNPAVAAVVDRLKEQLAQ